MDEDLRIRGYSANTRASYLRCVRHFGGHFMRPPDQLTPEHVRQYQLYLTRDRHVSWPYFNQVVCALRRSTVQTNAGIWHSGRRGKPDAVVLVALPGGADGT